MHPQATNVSAESLDDQRFIFEPAGALELNNEYSGIAVTPAPISLSQTQACMSLCSL